MDSVVEKAPFLPNDDDEDQALESGSYKQAQPHSNPVRIILLTITLCIFSAFTGLLIGRRWPSSIGLATQCLHLTSQPSALTADLPITYHTARFNGSLLKENVYRQPAPRQYKAVSEDDEGLAVDAAWESLGVSYHSVLIPESMAEEVGLKEDQVKVRKEYGGGYVVNVEGLHQLHCLNLVRKGLWYNYPYYHARGEGAFVNGDYVLQKHVSHCLDIIRQQLMCTIDIGVMGQVWFQPASAEYPEAYVDFNTEHTCRSFEAVRE